MGPVRQNPIQS